jgi:hypothetical protein
VIEPHPKRRRGEPCINASRFVPSFSYRGGMSQIWSPLAQQTPCSPDLAVAE